MQKLSTLIQKLNLEPLEPEGGFFKRTYLSKDGYGSAIYYAIDELNFSKLHRLSCDEVYHFYCGSSVEVLMISPEGQVESRFLGSNLDGDESFQLIVPAGYWQGIKLREGKGFALMGTTCSPAFDFKHFELADREYLLKAYPKFLDRILRFV